MNYVKAQVTLMTTKLSPRLELFESSMDSFCFLLLVEETIYIIINLQ